MASNVVRLNVYALNNIIFDRDAPKSVAFSTQGCLLYDVSNSPQRTLSSGYQVYGMVNVPATGAADASGNDYYVAETLSQLVTIFNT
jgi:hypothetical protein